MPVPVTGAHHAEHYTWGDVDACDGWFLLRSPEMHIIEERMPPGSSEIRHHHVRARQFFYVLQGELSIEIDQQMILLSGGEGVEVAPGLAHQVSNRSGEDVRFLVTSQPPSHGDRIDD